MPGPAIGIDLRIDGLGQRPVRPLAIISRRGPVGRRAHERMPEPHPRADLEQPGRLRGPGRLGPQPELSSRPPHQDGVAGGVGRRDHQQHPGGFGELLDTPQETVLDPVRGRQHLRQAESACQLGRRQFQQRQRVPARLGHDPLHHPPVQR
jgi:hypothetical protein